MVAIRIPDIVLRVEVVDGAINVKKNAATVLQVLATNLTDSVPHARLDITAIDVKRDAQ